MWDVDCSYSLVLWQIRLSMSTFNLFGSPCNHYIRELFLLDALILIFSLSKFALRMIFYFLCIDIVNHLATSFLNPCTWILQLLSKTHQAVPISHQEASNDKPSNYICKNNECGNLDGLDVLVIFFTSTL
ncbi:hypothetical protein EUGRSUZ_A00804 [Eucalyptus grandis]|uniref:Uncharacterized protein n=2 Tax=Eucalyptus grandis TaxID=71139 RepID=A0A059DCZ9_EUCGR|nr:hypothetical protein EUGRSUZ_A00804 [Eucalyptus grandis]